MENWLLTRSVVLQNWPIAVSTILIAISIILVFHRKQDRPQRTQLADEEYVEDYQYDDHDESELSPAIEEKEPEPYRGATKTIPGGATAIYNILNDRRSVRMFSTRSVKYEDVEKCIYAAGTSPSGVHTEPWTFCVVGNMDVKKQIREIVEFEEEQNYAQRMSRQWTTDLKPLKTNHIKEYLTDAPYLILVFKQIYGFCKDGRKKQHYYNKISVSAATGLLIAALQCAGLNSLVTTPLNCGPALRALLQRPANEKLMMLIPTGYAAKDCVVPAIQRKSVDEILVKYV